MARDVLGGPINPVRVITSADLVENGGTYTLQGKAVPVHGFSAADRKVVGGAAIPVYVVSQAELDAGTFEVIGGAAMPVVDAVAIGDTARQTEGRFAIPVWPVNAWPP